MKVKGPKRLRNLSLNSLAPNILTLLALCAGLTSMRFALQERWEPAVAAILVAAVLDGLDGRLARLLKGASKFGAELDSLSDFVCFGVAPAFLLYQWTLISLGGIGWTLVLAYSVCCALRLARFNTALEDPDQPAWASNFFAGVAAPAGAGLSMFFMVQHFQGWGEIFRSPYVNGAWLSVVAFLMVSKIPTFSFKRLHVRRDYILPTLVAVGVGAAVTISYPWLALTGLAVIYLATFPWAIRSHMLLTRQWRLQHADTAATDAPSSVESDAPADQPADEDDEHTFH